MLNKNNIKYNLLDRVKVKYYNDILTGQIAAVGIYLGVHFGRIKPSFSYLFKSDIEHEGYLCYLTKILEGYEVFYLADNLPNRKLYIWFKEDKISTSNDLYYSKSGFKWL